ncbi:MAG: GxxExxY protein [Candidatus Hydrogenedentes bacterium]|nr:GxxExxY protein [Candidatus Hydrogenedentota bacterium]
MNTDKLRCEHDELTEQVIGCVYAVANELAVGFVEKVYENALIHELRKHGLQAEQQINLNVYYDDLLVGEFFVDILVSRILILELKAVKQFDDVHMAQCLNYLKASGLRTCLLINFGTPRVEIKRISR